MHMAHVVPVVIGKSTVARSLPTRRQGRMALSSATSATHLALSMESCPLMELARISRPTLGTHARISMVSLEELERIPRKRVRVSMTWVHVSVKQAHTLR